MPSPPFLTARWVNLALLQYAVEADDLAPHTPDGLEPDLLNGRPHVSLVAFDFLDTRVRGVRWPGLVNFPEINLRFYVRKADTGERGVCFIQELVPKAPIAWTARLLYNEPYATAAMRSRTVESGESIRIRHAWKFRGTSHSLAVHARKPAITPPPDSREHFFKEHELGFGRSLRGRTLVYRVEHPVWAIYPDASARLRVDFASLYGPRWAKLTARTPDSVILAAGSPIKVYPAGK